MSYHWLQHLKDDNGPARHGKQRGEDKAVGRAMLSEHVHVLIQHTCAHARVSAHNRSIAYAAALTIVREEVVHAAKDENERRDDGVRHAQHKHYQRPHGLVEVKHPAARHQSATPATGWAGRLPGPVGLAIIPWRDAKQRALDETDDETKRHQQIEEGICDTAPHCQTRLATQPWRLRTGEGCPSAALANHVTHAALHAHPTA